MRTLMSGAVGIAMLTLPMLASAENARVYMGLTPIELADLAKRAGWKVTTKMTPKTRQIWIELTSGETVIVYLTDCGAANRCKAGYILLLTYASWWNQQDVGQWNHSNHGAVVYQPGAARMKRPLYFRGVTEIYLKEVIASVWPKARRSMEVFDRDVFRRTKPKGK